VAFSRAPAGVLVRDDHRPEAAGLCGARPTLAELEALLHGLPPARTPLGLLETAGPRLLPRLRAEVIAAHRQPAVAQPPHLAVTTPCEPQPELAAAISARRLLRPRVPTRVSLGFAELDVALTLAVGLIALAVAAVTAALLLA
jgi:hypothetical protein